MVHFLLYEKMPSPNEIFVEEGHFEGPEKNLQVIFANQGQESSSLRQVTQDRWQVMLDKAKCQILSSIANEQCTAYVLSESSLFVYDDRVIIKTCGTTPLLYSLDEIILIGKQHNQVPAAVLYWRKNFHSPDLQNPIHRCFKSEVDYLDKHLGCDNSHFTQIGSKEKDHFHIYYTELLPAGTFKPVIPVYEIKMHELHPRVSEKFFWCDKEERPEILNQIQNTLPDYEVNEFFFKPCGYSMNAIHLGNYETIHITPEDSCSYMSFETTDERYIKKFKEGFRIMELFRPACCSTIRVTPNTVPPDKLKEQKPSNYNAITAATTTLGNISVAFHSYETSEDHPMIKIALLRQKRNAPVPVQSTIE
jgi:S-adenosylmethionine decarboxylase